MEPGQIVKTLDQMKLELEFIRNLLHMRYEGPCEKCGKKFLVCNKSSYYYSYPLHHTCAICNIILCLDCINTRCIDCKNRCCDDHYHSCEKCEGLCNKCHMGEEHGGDCTKYDDESESSVIACSCSTCNIKN